MNWLNAARDRFTGQPQTTVGGGCCSRPRTTCGATQPLQTSSPHGTLRLGPGSVYPTACTTKECAAQPFVFGDKYYPAATSYQYVEREIVPR